VIFEHDTAPGRWFDVGLVVAIVASVAAVMAESIASVRVRHEFALHAIEWVFTVLFTIEYGLRIWCVRERRAYATSFFGIIDLLAVIPTYLSLLFPGGQFLMVIRILRVMRVFRVLKLTRYVGEAGFLVDAIRSARYKISVFLVGVLSAVVVVGSLMYLLEGPASGFTSIPKGIYWGVVTLTTVGYGDISPQTPLGQTLAALVMVLGYGIIAVPTGIVTAELTQMPRSGGPAAFRCPACRTPETDPDARYCRRCGGSLTG
jgi:voltage-gated potassium channel